MTKLYALAQCAAHLEELATMFGGFLQDSSFSMELQQVSLAAKTGERKKARETCNTWHAH